MYIPIKKRTLYKSELMMLEMLANTNWERPLYIAISVGPGNFLGLDPFFVQEGLAYRITPFDWRQFGYPQVYGEGYAVDSEKMYDNLMHKFKFGGINNKNVYLDENIMRMCTSHRRLFAILVKQLIKEGKNDKALEALQYCDKMIPNETVPYDFQNGALDLSKAYIQLGKEDAANKILEAVGKKSFEYINWYMSMDNASLAGYAKDCIIQFYLLDDIIKQMQTEKQKPAFMDKFNKDFETLNARFSQRVQVGA